MHHQSSPRAVRSVMVPQDLPGWCAPLVKSQGCPEQLNRATAVSACADACHCFLFINDGISRRTCEEHCRTGRRASLAHDVLDVEVHKGDKSILNQKEEVLGGCCTMSRLLSMWYVHVPFVLVLALLVRLVVADVSL